MHPPTRKRVSTVLVPGPTRRVDMRYWVWTPKTTSSADTGRRNRSSCSRTRTADDLFLSAQWAYCIGTQYGNTYFCIHEYSGRQFAGSAISWYLFQFAWVVLQSLQNLHDFFLHNSVGNHFHFLNSNHPNIICPSIFDASNYTSLICRSTVFYRL